MRKVSREVNLRATDRETARVVAILGEDGSYIGAGCLLNGAHVLSCCHVVSAALGGAPSRGKKVNVKLIGIRDQPVVPAVVEKLGPYAKTARSVDDLALMRLEDEIDLPAAEFATPIRHAEKRYSVLGFPDGDPAGRSASGLLHAANAEGLVQMDGNSALFVKGGFSGAPVWSQDLRAFVGIVVSELYDSGVAWCIPSRVLCAFYNDLPVRFRIPLPDRPEIHDREEDDPNVHLFGTVANDGRRKLEGRAVWNSVGGYYDVKVTYIHLPGSSPARGKYVTFITYPNFGEDEEDAYELFSEIAGGKAITRVYPQSLFTIAAIGDGGDTVLTLDLSTVEEEEGEND